MRLLLLCLIPLLAWPADNYLYLPGQGAKTTAGTLPGTVDGQMRQTLQNVKTALESAGLTLDHVVYAQVYLTDMGQLNSFDRAWREHFPKNPPARAVLGVAKLAGTPVEVTAVAVRDVAQKKVVSVPGYEPASAGILTADRLFISGTPKTQAGPALDALKSVAEAAGLSMAHLVFVNPFLTSASNPFLTSASPMRAMNEEYARRFEFGNTPARATIEVASLPNGATIEFTGVAVRDLSQRRAVRPKNMPPSPTASPCVFAGDTFYCSAKSGFIPGLNGGIFAASVENQLRQTMRNLLDNLEEAGLSFNDVVSTTVYLDDISEAGKIDGIYAKYFPAGLPSRTTVQQLSPQPRSANAEGVYPTLEQISLIAVRHN
ncbi:MAG: RidA family protein [Bryobacteraceae bacterium]